MHNAVFGAGAADSFRAAGVGVGAAGFQKKGDSNKLLNLHLHTLLPMSAVATYAKAFVASRVEIIPHPGLKFKSADEAESAGTSLSRRLIFLNLEMTLMGCHSNPPT